MQKIGTSTQDLVREVGGGRIFSSPGFWNSKTVITELRGTTGRIFETETLGGTCRARFHGYLSYHQAIREVIHSQPCNPMQPKGEAANFRNAVVSKMVGLGFHAEALTKVGIFTGLGTSLDINHKRDGFFGFDGVIVTVDCTINEDKDDECCKADVLVTGVDAVNGYEEAAIRIANIFARDPRLRYNYMEGGVHAASV